MHPVIAALKHHKTTVALVALEIALTCAIVTNALSLIGDRVAAMHVATGVPDDQLVWATASVLDVGDPGRASRGAGLVAADRAALLEIPGVRSVAMSDALPLNGISIATNLYPRAGDRRGEVANVDIYLGSPGILETMGVRIAAGRRFRRDDFADYDPFGNRPPPPVAIVTRKLAGRLWPGQNPLGKPVYLDHTGKQVVYVIGVAAHLLSPDGTPDDIILPVKRVAANPTYVLRVARDQRAQVARAIPAALQRIDPARAVTAHVYADTVASYFHGDRAMVWLLAVVIVCLLAVTALGVVGLSSFWVQQRTRTIGVRRALGATRSDILRYFQTENFLIVTLGVALGAILAMGMNLLLMQHYEVPRLPLWYLPVGAVALWLLGQFAVLAPALRASHVSPMVATRSV